MITIPRKRLIVGTRMILIQDAELRPAEALIDSVMCLVRRCRGYRRLTTSIAVMDINSEDCLGFRESGGFHGQTPYTSRLRGILIQKDSSKERFSRPLDLPPESKADLNRTGKETRELMTTK